MQQVGDRLQNIVCTELILTMTNPEFVYVLSGIYRNTYLWLRFTNVIEESSIDNNEPIFRKEAVSQS